MAEATKLLARTHQTMIWSRQRQTNQLRSLLREFYPGALAAFGTDLAGRDSLAVLGLAPTPEQGKALSRSKVEVALRRAGRARNLTRRAGEIVTALRTEQLTARPGLVAAYGASTAALVAVIGELARQTQVLEAEVEACWPAPGR